MYSTSTTNSRQDTPLDFLLHLNFWRQRAIAVWKRSLCPDFFPKRSHRWWGNGSGAAWFDERFAHRPKRFHSPPSGEVASGVWCCRPVAAEAFNSSEMILTQSSPKTALNLIRTANFFWKQSQNNLPAGSRGPPRLTQLVRHNHEVLSPSMGVVVWATQGKLSRRFLPEVQVKKWIKAHRNLGRETWLFLRGTRGD